MECSVAIQVLPMDAATDEETIRVVDAVLSTEKKVGKYHREAC